MTRDNPDKPSSKIAASTDIQQRAQLVATLLEHIEQIPGTQATKAEQLGITQPRLNDLLKGRIEKFSLDALTVLAKKINLSVRIDTQLFKIDSPPTSNVKQKLAHTAFVFAPHPSQLGSLDSSSGTELFLSLLRCETMANGLNPKDIVLSLNITSSDGGIDAKVDKSTAKGALLSAGSIHYQIKTGESFKPWQPSALKKELFGKSKITPAKKNLGDAIKNCLDQNGTYALVTFGHDLLPSQHTNAINHLTELFKACGYKSPKVEVYGQGQLAGEIEKYPSICLDLIGLSDSYFLTTQAWQKNAQMQTSLKLGAEQTAFITDIQSILLDNSTQHIRIIGEPGIGKTRLILESVSINEISPSVIYIPTGEDFQKSKLFIELLKPDKDYAVTLVIDDCDNRDRASIWSALKGKNRVKLITIDHGPDDTHDSDMKIIFCPKLQDEQIKGILQNYLEDSSDLHHWAEWCSGSPRVAHAVGENLKSNPADILKSPADVDIWDRFIIGHKEMNSHLAEQYRIVLRYIALFNRFGFEHPVHEEGKFISNLVQEADPTITYSQFQKIVQHYRSKRILQGRHTLFIVPKALHIYLWVDFWDKHGQGFDIKAFLDKIPGTMKGWFMQLFIYAQGPKAKPAQKVVKNILSTDGPFANSAFLTSEQGLRFINYLSEADPASTLALLENTIKKWPHKTLQHWHSGRQDIVWALEKIAIHNAYFTRAVDILIPMALAENAENSNNSRGLLLSLFKTGFGWAPTEAPPSERYPILQELVMSNEVDHFELGLELCQKWLSNYGGSRLVGAEYQGLKLALEFWRPQTRGELFDYWRQVLRFLRKEMKGFNHEKQNKIAEVLIGASKNLLQVKNIANEIMDILFELANNKHINRKSLTRLVIWHLKIRHEQLDDETLNKIHQLDMVLTGESLWDRINRYVLHTNWDEDYTFKGEEYKELTQPTERVKKTAAEYTKEITVFTEHLPKLLKESGHRLPQFGVECGELASPEFDEVILAQVESSDKDINCTFLGGYLAGVRSQNISRWEAHLHRLLNNKNLCHLAVECVWRSGLTESLVKKMLTMLENGEITSTAFERFSFRHDRENITDTLFQEVITTILENIDETSASISTQLVRDYYFDQKNQDNFPEALVLNVITSPSPKKNQDQMYTYNWNTITKKFVKKHPQHNLSILSYILNNMGRMPYYGDSHYIFDIADDVIKTHPLESWKLISDVIETDSQFTHEIFYWLGDNGFENTGSKGAIGYMPADEIISWIKENPKERLWKIQEVLPKTLEQSPRGELTRMYLEEFGDIDGVSNSLFIHFHMGGWSGNESDYLSRKRDSARRWLSETSSLKVRLWLERYIDYLSNRIENTIIQEERIF